MSAKLRMHISQRICECLKDGPSVTPEYIKSFVQVGPGTENGVRLDLQMDPLQKQLGIPNCNSILYMHTDSLISKVFASQDKTNKNISFEINRDAFLKDVLENIARPDRLMEKKKVIVEFSSPNIAKPFHVGHLRSTIIGNYIANLSKFLGNNVLRLNYLGDWGTQFGMLKVGVERAQLSDEDIRKDPLRTLYDAYVMINKMAKLDPSINERARNVFKQLEDGQPEDIENWKTYTKLTIKEMRTIYKRLGVTFDEYNFESAYTAKELQTILGQMETKRMLRTQDGKRMAMVGDKTIPLVKSDGSMLYLTRDIAAAVDRYEKHKFHQMYYVVDNSQSDHFHSLQNLLYQLDLPWASRIKHVKFGRIRGMSTRKGTAVFLKDILDEARDLMQKRQIESPTTKVSMTDSQTSDILGVSCVIVNDLKQRRQKDYNFEWDKVLQTHGDTGIKLQYTHCRLSSLRIGADVMLTDVCRPDLLTQPEVMNLAVHLAQFNDVLVRSHREMEACLLVVYLFYLCNHISKALKVLRVKDQNPELSSQRMLLFDISKEILRQGMTILGLKPLTQM